MMFTFELKGFEELKKQLDILPDNLSRKVSQQAVTSTLNEVAKPAIVNAAPRAKDKRSKASLQYGQLYTNIRVERMKRSRSKHRKASRVFTGDAFWGHIYENGAHDEFGNLRQPPRPWFRPAVDIVSPQIFETLGNKIGDGIIKELTK